MDDLDAKIERLFGLLHEELRMLRDLVALKIQRLAEDLGEHDKRLDDHDKRLAALERD